MNTGCVFCVLTSFHQGLFPTRLVKCQIWSFFQLRCADHCFLYKTIPSTSPYCPWTFCETLQCFRVPSVLFSGTSGSLLVGLWCLGSWRLRLEGTPPSSLQKTFVRGVSLVWICGPFFGKITSLWWVSCHLSLSLTAVELLVSQTSDCLTPVLCPFHLTVKKHPLWRNLGLSTLPSYADSNINKHQFPFGVRAHSTEKGTPEMEGHVKILVWNPHLYGKTHRGVRVGIRGAHHTPTPSELGKGAGGWVDSTCTNYAGVGKKHCRGDKGKWSVFLPNLELN